MFYWRYQGMDILLRDNCELDLMAEVSDGPEDRVGYHVIPATRKKLEKRMFAYLEKSAATDWDTFWRRFVFHSYYDCEAAKAFPDLLDAYCRSTLRAMLVSPEISKPGDIANAMAAGNDAFCIAVYPRWPRILWRVGIRPERNALIMIPKNRIDKLAGTVQNFFVGYSSGKTAFRETGVECVLYESGPEAVLGESMHEME